MDLRHAHSGEERQRARRAFLAVTEAVAQLDAILRGMGYTPSGEAWWQELLDARGAILAAYGEE